MSIRDSLLCVTWTAWCRVAVCQGHALYEQGRNLEHDGLPVNSALSMGVHESQSLLWERMVALGRPFAAYLLPKLQVTGLVCAGVSACVSTGMAARE